MVTKEVNKFYREDPEYSKLFKKKKKISLDINLDYLQFIDELAKLTSNSRTVIVHALISDGIFPFLDRLEKTWTDFLNDDKYKTIEGDLKKLLAGVKKLRESPLIS
jgi:hypothetical protein